MGMADLCNEPRSPGKGKSRVRGTYFQAWGYLPIAPMECLPGEQRHPTRAPPSFVNRKNPYLSLGTRTGVFFLYAS